MRQRTKYQAARPAFAARNLHVTKTQFTSLSHLAARGHWWLCFRVDDPDDEHACTTKAKAITRADVVRFFDTLTQGLTWAESQPETPFPAPASRPITPPARPAASLFSSNGPSAPAAPASAPPDVSVVPAPSGSLDAAVDARIEARLGDWKPSALPSRDELLAELARLVDQRPPQRVEIVLPDVPDPVSCDGEHEQFPALIQELGLGHSVLAAGPSGSGKTTAFERAAVKLGLRLFVQPPVSDRFELLGFVDASGSYQASPAYRWVECEEPALLLLDELDRSHPNSLTAMHTLLANGMAVFPHEQKSIPEGHVIGATANTWGLGTDVEYVGSCKLDAATVNRFQSRLTWDYDHALEERIAIASHGGTVERVAACVTVRARLREKGIRLVWGPRDTFGYCRRRHSGLTHDVALSRSALATLKPEQRNEIVQASEIA